MAQESLFFPSNITWFIFLKIFISTKMIRILKKTVWQKSIPAFVCLIFLTQIIFAQGGWTLIRRGGTGDLVSVFFTSSEKGWLGGDEGYLAITTDGGKNWLRQAIATKENVNEIYFRNDENGYVLAGGRLFLSKDGGKTWRENVLLNSKDYRGLKAEFLSIRFTDKKRGWIVGSLSNQKDEVVDSLILQTQDAGETWSRVLISYRQELFHLDFVNDSDGWIVGDKGLVFVTDDGGKTWMKQATGILASLYNVDFRDSKNGVIVGGGGAILRTEDGGLNWEKIRAPVTKSLLRVNFIDDKTGWIVGGSGTILRTDDKGKTWIQQDSQTTDSLYGLFMDKKAGWAVGKKGIVLRYSK